MATHYDQTLKSRSIPEEMNQKPHFSNQLVDSEDGKQNSMECDMGKLM